jgi:hypothetical protein
MTSKRKREVEELLRGMNELLMKMLQKGDNKDEYQQCLKKYLRCIASIRERMLASNCPQIDEIIRAEVIQLENNAKDFISLSSSCVMIKKDQVDSVNKHIAEGVSKKKSKRLI